MADPEEDKNKAATPSEPGKRSEQNDETDTNIRLQSAAEKPPSNEATEDLLELLGTVGSAGLGASVIAAKIAPPPQPASQQTPTNATPTTSQPTELLQQAPTPESARHEDDNISEPISKPEHISNTRTMSNEFFAQTLQPPPLADQRNLQNRVAGLDEAKAGSLGRHRKSEPNKKIQKEDAIEQGDAIESHNPSATTAAIEQYSASEQFVDEHHTKQANNEVSETEASVHQRNDEHLEKASNEASSQHITSKDYANDSSANGAADTADIPPDATSSPTSQIQPANKSQEAVLRTVTKFRSELYPNGVPEAVKTEDKDTDIDSSPPLSDRFADQARKSMRALAQLIPDRENQTKFQTIAPGAVNEISNGTLGSATVAIFAIAERLGLVEPLLEGYREIAKNGSSSLENLQHNKQAREIHMRIRGAAPAAVAQRFILRLVPKTTAELKAQFTLRDKLDIDPLTTRSRPPDMDYGSGLEIDTLARAKQISQTLIDAPSSVEIENIELPPQNLHLLEFARAQGASGDNLNLYLRYAFYKTNSPRIRQEAMQGLRDEVLSGDNPSAIYVFQEVWINKALIELKEYQRQNDEQGILEALTQIIALEDSAPQLRPIIQNLAGEFRDRAVGQATVQQAHRATSEIAQTTFASASQAYTSFFNREIDQLQPERRQDERLDAILQLRMAAEQRLNLLGRDDFSQLLNSLGAISAILAIAETNKADTAGAELSKLIRLHLLNENTDALHYLKQLHTAFQKLPNPPSTEIILKALLSDNLQDQDVALRILKSSLPNVHSQLDELRLQLLSHRLNSGCNSSDINEIARILEQEETLFHNQAAGNLLRWAQCIEASNRIDEAIKARNLEDIESVKATAETIRSEMERLSSVTLQANEHARAALIGMLLCGTEEEAREAFKQQCEFLPYEPDLGLLSATERSIIREHAALSIEESLKKNPNIAPLKVADAAAIATALAETYANGDRNVEKATELVFDSALKCLSRSAAIDGLLQSMEKDLPGSAKLSDIIYKALLMPEAFTQAQRQKLAALAREGVRGAIRALAAICASESPHAASAANELIKAGATSSNRDLILSIMLDYALRNADKHSLLSALGDIASRDYPVRPLVMETIRQALEVSASKPDSPEHKSAQKGFLFLAENWSTKEIETLRNHLKLEMLAALPTIADKLAPGIRGLFIDAQHEVLISGNADERLAAVQALAALGRFTGPDLAADIGFFVTPQGRVELERCGMNRDKLSIFIDFAARALLAMLASANPKVQEAAVDAFRRQGNWPGILSSVPLRNMIIDYVQGRSVELENNKEAMQFVYDASLGRPLTAVFRELCVGGEKISTQQLLQLADRAASNYTNAKIDGRAVVQKILANAATFNALPYQLRERLTGFSNEIDLSLLAGQLINGTIDANSSEFKFLFYDLHKRLRDEQQDLESKAASLQVVTRGAGENIRQNSQTVEQESKNIIGLGKSFRDCYGNALKENSRAAHAQQERSVANTLSAARGN